MTADPLRGAARVILRGFDGYRREFDAITRRAERHFAAADWHADRRDATRRLEWYAEALRPVEEELRRRLGDAVRITSTWIELKAQFAPLAADDRSPELAQTFFNSVRRKLIDAVGADPLSEFIDLDPAPLPAEPEGDVLEHIPLGPDPVAALRRLAADRVPGATWVDLDGDAARAAASLAAGSRAAGASPSTIELLRPAFYRDRAAYLIGRLRDGRRTLPLALALRHEAAGLRIDAVLTDESEVSILFSFTRSYFHVLADRPRDLVAVLRSVMPLKPLSELYTALGFNKHGKTVRYREIMRHLRDSTDGFVPAEGDRGMVMIVFTLRELDVVFKVIRDTFPYPKHTTRETVKQRYRLVSKHDRVGRLVDAQEYEHLGFSRHRFAPEVLEELLAEAGDTVSITGDQVVIGHVYIERKITPLNLFLERAAPAEARRAALDYGMAIRDLAAANIFPGDFLLKNFGVTRHGRVVFYDYDELCMVTDCRFRRMPSARTPEEELAPEPWFTVGPDDVFPEEFGRFVGLREPLRGEFATRHGDLFDASFWRDLQRRHHAGEFLDFRPYPDWRRLPAAGSG